MKQESSVAEKRADELEEMEVETKVEMVVEMVAGGGSDKEGVQRGRGQRCRSRRHSDGQCARPAASGKIHLK